MPVNQKKIDQINTRSEFFQDILDRIPPKIVTCGNTGMLMILMILVLGLNIIRYPDVITAEATITNENAPVEVYSRTSGRVSHFLKHDKELIRRGDWILVLNNSADYKEIISAEKLLEGINLKAFWKTVSLINFQEFTTLGEVQKSYFEFSRSVGELKLYNKLKSQEKFSTINSSRKKGLISKEKVILMQIETGKKQLEITKADYERTLKLYNQKIVAKSEMEQKQIIYLNAKNNLEVLNSNLINTQIESEGINKDITSLAAEKDDTYFKLQNNILSNYNDLVFELSQWENKYVLTSPIDGEMNLYDIRNENQYLSAEKRIFTVTPLKIKGYFAILNLPVENSGKVFKNQNCVIKLHNFSYIEFGMLKGKIQSISSTPKEGFYSVRVKLPNQLLTTQHKRLKASGELSGTVEIIIDDLTLFEKLFYSLVEKN